MDYADDKSYAISIGSRETTKVSSKHIQRTSRSDMKKVHLDLSSVKTPIKRVEFALTECSNTPTS